MTELDFSPAVTGVSGLKGVVISSVPDCLLIDSWFRYEALDTADDLAAYIGNVFRSVSETLLSMNSTGQGAMLTIEAKDALLVLRVIHAGFVGGFIFDRASPVGLVRLQTKQIAESLRVALARETEEGPPEKSVPAGAPPGAKPVEVRRRPPEANTHIEFPSTSGRRSSKPPARTPTPTAKVYPAKENTDRLVNASTLSSVVPIPHLPAGSSAALNSPPSYSPRRASELISFFRRSSPNPQEALLRLSLKSGVSREMLDHPGALGEEQIKSIEGSIRDLMGGAGPSMLPEVMLDPPTSPGLQDLRGSAWPPVVGEPAPSPSSGSSGSEPTTGTGSIGPRSSQKPR